MNTKSWMKAMVFAALAYASACDDNDDTTTPADTEGSDSDGDDAVCDPVGFDPVMGMLLNAPLADDVETIDKVPQHPGPPGPVGLP